MRAAIIIIIGIALLIALLVVLMNILFPRKELKEEDIKKVEEANEAVTKAKPKLYYCPECGHKDYVTEEHNICSRCSHGVLFRYMEPYPPLWKRILVFWRS